MRFGSPILAGTPAGWGDVTDFEQAAAALAKERANQWQNDEHLGSSFFRLGFLHQMTTAIARIINKIKPGYLLSEMYRY